MNTALEQLLTTKATLNSCQRELAQNANSGMHQNENQATEAIKEAEGQYVATIREAESHCAAMIREVETHCEVTIKEVEACHATQAYALEQSHEESMLKLEHEVLVEEGHDHPAFMEACSTALWACPLKAHGVLMYPLQLLTDNVPLSAMLATTLQPATAGRELLSTASLLTVSGIPAPQTRTKQWHCSFDQEPMTLRPEEEEATGLDVTPEEHPCQRQKEMRAPCEVPQGEPSESLQTRL